MKTQGPFSCLSVILSSCCNYFFPGGLALCNHEPGLGGPNAAQSGAECGFTRVVCRANLLPAAASGLHRPNLSISTRHGPDNHFRKNARNSPLSEATKRRWKLDCQRHSPKNAIGITCGHRNATMNVCTPSGSKPRGRMEGKCHICHFANKPGRPQHNTQHNGSS